MKTELAPLFTLRKATALTGWGAGWLFNCLKTKAACRASKLPICWVVLTSPCAANCAVRASASVLIMCLFPPAKTGCRALLALLVSAEMGRNLAADLQALPAAGLTSVKRARVPNRLYRAAGYYPTRNRAIRLDMLERLADLIRPLLNGEAEQEAAKAQAPEQPVANTEKSTPAPSNEANETRVAPENEPPQVAVQDEPASELASEPASETADEALHPPLLTSWLKSRAGSAVFKSMSK